MITYSKGQFVTRTEISNSVISITESGCKKSNIITFCVSGGAIRKCSITSLNGMYAPDLIDGNYDVYVDSYTEGERFDFTIVDFIPDYDIYRHRVAPCLVSDGVVVTNENGSSDDLHSDNANLAIFDSTDVVEAIAVNFIKQRFTVNNRVIKISEYLIALIPGLRDGTVVELQYPDINFDKDTYYVPVLPKGLVCYRVISRVY